MQSFYNFVSGPLVWVAFAVFLGGSIWRIWSLLSLTAKKDTYVTEYWSWKHAFRSIAHWIIPFRSMNSRMEPVMSIVTFVFHICLVLVPLFTLGHIVLLEESVLGWSWPTLPDYVADIAAILVLVGCVYFAWRRLSLPQVKFVTTASDFVILAIVAAPFLTGVLAYHQIGGALLVTTLHILAGELMLVCIPFTRLAHMLYFVYTRGYTASEFGAVRHVKDW
ncbi:respiratory nitrate reductase subunit gamma [Desulfobaculum bizertense]|uniref:TmcC family electron transfer complex membrane anchor subunit n=1 Tax=Desulfobaculum bizertense TaxID=376490 RepID=UPI001F331418|nr:respiratory nitrate reductase subunit gamma [Desulfobaculum bizertense]UIJ39264.1 respiratory nitrate reductase subunit gamma [Desulfobaculum bizertense]